VNIVLWVLASLLAAVFLAAGSMKLSQPVDKLVASGFGWAQKVPVGATLGTLEVLGALGLILPAVLGIAPVLVPLAAGGVVLVMVGAIGVHQREGEWPAVAVTLVLLIAVGVRRVGSLRPPLLRFLTPQPARRFDSKDTEHDRPRPQPVRPALRWPSAWSPPGPPTPTTSCGFLAAT
jgi:uncharacterized membrane protein YphA (DoxX/SURF4 family)